MDGDGEGHWWSRQLHRTGRHARDRGDPAHTPAWLVEAAREAFAPLGAVGLDSPFAGTYVPLAHYGRDERVLSLMVELRRDLYLTEPDGPMTAGFQQVAAALTGLVDRCTYLPPAPRSTLSSRS